MASGLVTIEEARHLFACIEDGSVVATPTKAPVDVYCGNVDYELSNGWRMTVFNDCGSEGPN